jgi:hypothetical protein
VPRHDAAKATIVAESYAAGETVRAVSPVTV